MSMQTIRIKTVFISVGKIIQKVESKKARLAPDMRVTGRGV